MINSYLNETAILKTISHDKYGEPTESTQTIKCKIEYETKLIRSAEGEQVVSDMMVYIKNNITVKETDKVYFDSKNHDIIKISKKADFSNRFVIIYIK